MGKDKNTTKSYGFVHPIVCPNCGQEKLDSSKASDVNFGDISTDIVIIYCPKCKEIESAFPY